MKHPAVLRSVLFGTLAALLFLLLLTHTELAMDGVRQGLSLCTETLIPSLFPFLVISELLIAMGAGELLGKIFARPVRFLFGLSAPASAALLLGVLCGSPTAMTSAAALQARGEITTEEVKRLSLFANIPSSGFLVGAVGTALFGNKSAGLALFLITLTTTLLIGVALRFLCGAPGTPVNEQTSQNQNAIKKRGLTHSDITSSIKRGFAAMLGVCSFLLFFSAIISCLKAYFPKSSPSVLQVILFGVLEMTSGISLAVTALEPTLAFCLTAFFAGFSGFSICLQLFSVTEGKGMNIFSYLIAKMFNGILNFILSFCFVKLADPVFVCARGVLSFAPIKSCPFPHALVWSLLLAALCLILAKKAPHLKIKK